MLKNVLKILILESKANSVQGTPGFKQGAKIDIMGQRGSNAAKLTFDNCLVPRKRSIRNSIIL